MKRSKELQINICNDYSNEKISIEKLLEKYNLSPASLYRILKKNNIEKRSFHASHENKLEVNENYFEIIDSENKAYWLGFLIADSHIYYTSENFGRVQISMSVENLYHLEKFKSDLNIENKISFVSIKNKNICKLSINRIKLCNDLEKYKHHLPKLDSNLTHHYFRGLIDGDGIFTISKITNLINFIFKSAEADFIAEFREFLLAKLDIIPDKSVYFKYNLYHLKYEGDIKVKKLFDYLYQDCNLKIESKYEFCKNYFNLTNKNHGLIEKFY